MAKSLVIWQYRYFDSNQNGAANLGISGDGVIFLLLLKEIWLQLSHNKALWQVLLQYASHTAETDKVSLVLSSPTPQPPHCPNPHHPTPTPTPTPPHPTHPAGAHVGLLYTLLTIDTQESKLRVRLELEVLAKLMAGENSSWEFPKVGVRLILQMCLILETVIRR